MATKQKSPRITAETKAQMRQMLANTTKSVDEVAKVFGVSKGTVYYHTGGKRYMVETATRIAVGKAVKATKSVANANMAKSRKARKPSVQAAA